MDYFDFKNFFKDKYKINDEIWSMDDIDVVDYTGLEQDARTLFYAKIDKDIDRNYNVLDPDAFADKIYKAICNRYGEEKIKALFINTAPLGGKYPEIAKKALMKAEGMYGFDLYFTNKRTYSYKKGLLCEDFSPVHIPKEILENLLNLKINSIYKYDENNKILLINCWNMSYLTDLETLAKYLKKPVDKLYKILYEEEIKNNNNLNEAVNMLSNIGLDIISQHASDSELEVKFKFPGNTIGTLSSSIISGFIITKEEDKTITYLNSLAHFVKDYHRLDRFETLDEAIETLEKYLIKNKEY